MPNTQQITHERYMSRGRQISKSRQHKDMFIIDNCDGTFHFLNTGIEAMLLMNPPDVPKTKKKVSKEVALLEAEKEKKLSAFINTFKMKRPKGHTSGPRGLADIR